MVDYKGAIWSPNSNFFPNTGKKSFLILHATAGGSSAQEIASYFQGTQGTPNPVSSHYIVGKDGTVVQTINEKDGAYGNGVVNNPNWTGNPNYYTISIEHVKSTSDNSEPLTPAQQAASFALIKDICQRNGIGMHEADDTTGITSHAAIDPINRSRCPGTYPWDALWSYLNGGNQPMSRIDLTNGTVASHFTGDDNIWTCKDNGFVIGHGILNFYRAFGGDALCGLSYLGLPRSNELSVKGYPGVTAQEFERGCVVYDPQKVLDNPPGSGPVYVTHVERDPRTVELLAKIADLQQQLNKDAQAQQIAQLQAENDQLKALLASSNLGQVGTLAAQIADDIALIMKLVHPQ